MASNGMAGKIYLIVNKITNEKYVGQTTGSLNRRFNRHCVENGCIYLHRAIKKYGRENFDIKKIDDADNKKELNEKEIYYIKLYNTLAPTGYNLTQGGQSIRADLPGRILTEPEKNKNSNTLKNFYGKEENKKGCLFEKQNKKEVYCFQTGKVYSSIREAALQLNLKSKSKISDILNGKLNSYNGYSFILTKNIDLSNIKIKPLEKTNEDRKIPIKCNETGKIYKCIREAYLDMGFKSKSKISDVLNGKLKSYKGYTFSRMEDKNGL